MSEIFSAILYYLIIVPVSLLPMQLLYVVAEFVYFILYRVTGYRKKVVRENIARSYPQLAEVYRLRIEKGFYRHLADLMVEAIKSFTISTKTLSRRITISNPELLQHYYDQGKSLVLVTGHYNNWEWGALSLPSHGKFHAAALYLPLSNKFFDKKMRSTRGKSGLDLVSTRKITRYIEENKTKQLAIAFVFDQSPSNPKAAYWTNFLSQETAVMKGPEYFAMKYNWPVLYGNIQKISRGHYTVTYEVVVDDPSSMKENEITERCVRLSEKIIDNDPQFWLWTHRRWKHKRVTATA